MLSKVQINTLRQLRDKDDTIYFMRAFDPHAFFRSNMKTASLTTLSALKKKGMLRLVKEEWSGGEYKISDKGKQVLEEAEQQ